MTTQHTAPATLAQKDLESFILWFLDLPELPLETKMAFVDHLRKTKSFDIVAQEYVADLMTVLAADSVAKAEELKVRIDLLDKEIEAEGNPKTSLAQKIAHSAIEKMQMLAQGFKNNVSAFAKEERMTQERFEHKEDTESAHTWKKNLKKA